MSIAPLRLGLTATPPEPGPAADRLTSLVGPVVFERSIGGSGRALPGAAGAGHLASGARSRRAPRARRALEPSTAQARRAFEGNHLGASWEDFLHDAARTDEGRRGLACLAPGAPHPGLPAPQAGGAGAAARPPPRAAHAGLRGRQPDRLRGGARAPGHAAHLRHRSCRAPGGPGPLPRRELRALVSAQVLNEGIDVPDAEVGIVVAGRMGEREHVQRVGRLLRPGDGKRALVYELVVERSSEARQAERRGERLAVRARSSA